MRHFYRSGRDVPQAVLQPASMADIVRIELAVFTRANCELAWQIFSDWERWQKASDHYRGLQWHGPPWIPGSRLQVEFLRPVRARVDRVITVCTPPRCVAWINHVLGYSMEQWVLFDPFAGSGTRVSTWLEFTGHELTINGLSMQETLESYLSQWYESYRTACDRAVAKV
jgi:hypothetical protein